MQQACRADQCHLLLRVLRRWLAAAGAARRQLDTLRRDLLKIGGRGDPWAARVRLPLASSHPGQVRWALLAARVAHE